MKGAPRAGQAVSKDTGLDGYLRFSAWPATYRCIYGPSPLLEEGTQNPHMVAQSRHWMIPGRRDGSSSGEGKLCTLECRNST